MHIEGHPLSTVSLGGFRSVARRIPAAWSTLEDAGYRVLLESMPGSTPPEIRDGVVLRGRWGGWGVDVHAVNFEKGATGPQRFRQGAGAQLFFFGAPLTSYIDDAPATDWQVPAPKTYSPPREAVLSAWGSTVYARLLDGKDDGLVSYDKVQFSLDKATLFAELDEGGWSEWTDVELNVKGATFKSNAMVHVIRLDDDGFFRLRIIYNNLNRFLTQPSEAAKTLTDSVGPMLDFVDNFPPQLIYYPEDRQTFLDEMHRSFDWHTASIPAIRSIWNPDAVIHDIYSPNQMLTSRWWLSYVDPAGDRYSTISEEDRSKRWAEVQGMYLRLDEMLGEIMDSVDEDTVVVFSSDHGACVLNTSVHLNNLLAKHGYLKFTVDPTSGIPTIDWESSTAVYLKMIGIFIHPEGLGGNWTRAKGAEYERLRTEISKLLLELKDDKGVQVVSSVTRWEDVEKFLDLASDRVGDLVISNTAGYGWTEEVSEDLAFFSKPLKSGYKQAILVDETKAMWTPFIVVGPGVRAGTKLPEPIQHIDQLPTILTLLGVPIPENVEGRVLKEIIQP